MIYNDDVSKEDPDLDDILDDTTEKGEVYEESEAGVVYSPSKPGDEQQAREAKKIIKKEDRNEQA